MLELLIGAGATLLTAVIGAALGFRYRARQDQASSEREHEKWLRDRRLEAYSGFLAASDRWLIRLSDRSQPPAEYFEEMATAQAAVDLIGSSSVKSAMRQMGRYVFSLSGSSEPPLTASTYWEAQRRFVEAAGTSLHPLNKGDKPVGEPTN